MFAIYTRLSREDEDSTSIKNQIREGREFAQSNDFVDTILYNEGEGVSGTWEIDKRPELSRLLEDIKNKKVSCVWFRNQNRLGRNMDTYIIFLNICVKMDVRIYFDNKEFDYTDPTQDLIGNVLSALNSYTTKLQSKQTKKALRDNVKQGRAHSVIAYGYGTDENGFLVVDATESEIIKRVFREHSSGIGCRTISERLTNEGVPTRRTKLSGKIYKWHDKTVRELLRNTIYYGKRKWGDEYFDVPAIITKDIFDKSQKAFVKNNNNKGKRVTHKYLLNDTLKCGVCGNRMTGRRRLNLSDNAYRCTAKRYKGVDKCHNRSINIDAMEDFVWNRFFVEKEFISLVKDAVNDGKEVGKVNSLEDDILSLQSQIKDLELEKKNAIRLAIKGLVSDEYIQLEIKSIDQKINGLVAKNDKVQEELNFIHNNTNKTKSLLKEIDSLKSNTPFNTKGEIIRKYINSITIKSVDIQHVLWLDFKLPIKDEIYIRWNKVFYRINESPQDVVGFMENEGIQFPIT